VLAIEIELENVPQIQNDINAQNMATANKNVLHLMYPILVSGDHSNKIMNS